MTKLLQDLRYALRQLRISPVFALVAIASLALGIGANTAIFQLLDAVRLRQLPIPHAEQLAEIRIVGGNGGFGINGNYGQLTRPVWWEIKERHEPFSGVFAWSPYDARIGRGSSSHPAKAIEASGEFFSVLGIQPWRGRLFGVGDGPESACKNPGVVVSYPYWQSQMAGREIGSNDTLIVDGMPEPVIGVTPPGFFGLSVGDSFDIAVPLCRSKDERAEVFDVTVMGRLRPGWSLDRASAQMSAASTGIFEATAPTGYSSEHIQTFKNFKLAVYNASTGVSLLRNEYDRSLWLLLGITALVLLIACANLANLMLARASVREREFAVRLAIGASRADLLRQSLTESGLIALVGTGAGIALAQGLSRVLIWSLSSDDNGIALATGIDWRVLLFAASVAVSTCLIFGVVPALRSVSAQPVTSMKSGGRGMTGARERFSAQRFLVVAQISVSLVLLVGALLFVRSFRSLINLDTGMREKGITLAFFQFNDLHLPKDRLAEFKRELLNEVRTVPGVLDAATTTNVPLLGGSWEHNIEVGAVEGSSKFAWVSPDYFQTIGVPVLEGRGIAESDTATSSRVAVVNQTFVRQFLGGANPIGRTLRTSSEPQYPSTVYEIVGVIPDTKYNDIRGGTPPMAFAPASQFPADGPWVAMMIYANASPETAIKGRLAEIHPEVVTFFMDFRSAITDGLKRERLLAMLSGFFGALAALLAMVGLYGVMSYMVARRRNEIGIRVALGANRGQVISMVMREAARLILLGAVAGTLLSLAAGRGAESLLFELKPHDPLTLAASVLLLAVVAACASFLPARRAAKVDPMEALRYE